MTQQLVMWDLLPAQKAPPRRSAGRFASGFSVTDDLFAGGFTLEPPAVAPAPGTAEAREREAARVRWLQDDKERKARKDGQKA